MYLTKAAALGLQALAAYGGAGGPADIGIEESGRGATAAWAGVQAAISWAGRLRPGRDIVLCLTPAEAEALDMGMGVAADFVHGPPAMKRAMQKLTDARLAFEDDRGGRQVQG